MSKFKESAARTIARVLAVFLVLTVALGGILPKRAYANEDDVRAVGEGVFKFNMYLDFVFTDDDGKPIRDAAGNEIGAFGAGRGSAFLINEDTILTCYHNASFSDEFYDYLLSLGYRKQEVLDHITYTVTVSGDVEIPCTLVNWSPTQDWAIFKLSQTVGGSRPLVLRDSSTVQAADAIWSVGFPGNSDVFMNSTYRPDDVTIKSGNVTRSVGDMSFAAPDAFGGLYYISGKFMQTSVAISGGDSGGPMVDANGYVVGINDSSDEGYYYGVAINEVTEVLDRLEIPYTSASAVTPTPEPEPTPEPSPEPTPAPTATTYSLDFKSLSNAIGKAQAVNADEYTAESYAALKTALDTALSAQDLTLSDNTSESEYKDKQGQIDDAVAALEAAYSALEKKPAGPNMGLIGGIIAGVVALGALLAVLLRKKPAPAAAPAQVTQQAPASTYVAPAAAPAQAPAQRAYVPATAPVAADPATTVLTDEDPATTILTEDVDGGYLTRMSTNERIAINRSEITVGRDHSAVDYCLEGNTNISRVHARIIVRNGQVFIVDNNTANGTFVNNAKLRSGQEQILKSGDIVRLADEKFRYNK